jgi:hypothetical protein
MHATRQVFSRSLTVCAGLLFLAAALNAQSEKWKNFKYTADGFRISFPSEPKLDQKKKEAKSGSILMNTYCSQISDIDLCVAVIDQGPEATGLTTEILMGRVKLGVVSGPKTRRLNQQEINLDGHKGIEIETVDDKIHTVTRIYAVNRTLYQTMVTYPIGKQFAGANRFLESFRLIPRVRK